MFMPGIPRSMEGIPAFFSPVRVTWNLRSLMAVTGLGRMSRVTVRPASSFEHGPLWMSQVIELSEVGSAEIVSDGMLIPIPQQRQISRTKVRHLLLIENDPGTLLFLLADDLIR
jgi:hypothetical protein